uniref:Uncharacterized protein LOC100176298 n=1 Tax=Phallusia mammillata TaxID=59560 RepID=A0A6F9DFX0_9ASCI|nr:uncharacterized protein LOC100176298 [Phallusia mammillata]
MRGDKRKTSKSSTDSRQGRNQNVEKTTVYHIDTTLSIDNDLKETTGSIGQNRSCKQVGDKGFKSTDLRLNVAKHQNDAEPSEKNANGCNPTKPLVSNNMQVDEPDGATTNNETISHGDDKDELQKENEDCSVKSNSHQNVASNFYSSLNLLATRAFINVKLEPVEVSVAERCGKDYMSSLENRTSTAGSNTSVSLYQRRSESQSPVSHDHDLQYLQSHAELSPQTFAEQLRHNDSASMVVCRSLPGKTSNQGLDSTNTSGAGRTNGSSLHHFVTRYTIEKPDESSRLGLDICLENDSSNEAIMEVECGGNKGLLYVTKLCQGSKGQSILFNDEWLTPNEFQFISGRETAKDWKRSIRHCGKSLKTLMTKGVLQVHPPVCECDYCKGQASGKTENTKPGVGLQNDTSLCADDMNDQPLSLVRNDASATQSLKQGREGGLNSIISQLHNKRANIGVDAVSPGAMESLDLRVSSSTNGSGNRKRRNDSSHNDYASDVDEDHSVSSSKKYLSDADENYRNQSYDQNSGNTQRQRTQPNPRWENERSADPQNTFNQWLNTENGFRPFHRPGFGYSEYALYDAMKRAVASVAAQPNGYCTQPPPMTTRHTGGGKKQPMMELTSPRNKNLDRKMSDVYSDWDYPKPIPQNMEPLNGNNMFNDVPFHNRVDLRTKIPRSTPDHNNNWFNIPSSHFQSENKMSFCDSASKRYGLKSDKRGKIGRSPSSHKTRSKVGNNRQSSNQKMVNLHNHAIPMMSLTFKNKRINKKSDSEKVTRSCQRSTDSSPPALASNAFHTSNDKHEATFLKPSDVSRRLSSSAPPSQVYAEAGNTTFSSAKQAKHFDFHNGAKHSSSALSPTPSQSVFGDLVQGECNNSDATPWQELSAALDEMGAWTVETVCQFLDEIGCGQYEQVFKDNKIDGDALPLLVERHLVDKMGLKLGHALKVIARVHRRLGTHLSLVTNQHCPITWPHGFYGSHEMCKQFEQSKSETNEDCTP